MSLIAALAALLAAGPIAAQEAPGPSLGRPVAPPLQAGRLLVIDRERVLAESERGRALLADLDEEGLALARENREIEARLRAEERALTERRPGMDPDAFRAEAEAFDARVQEIRDTQDAKEREVLARRSALQDRFWEGALPVLAAILQERGAVVVLDRDGVFLSSDSADITAEVVARLDAAAADGEGRVDAPPPGVTLAPPPPDDATEEAAPPAGAPPPAQGARPEAPSGGPSLEAPAE